MTTGAASQVGGIRRIMLKFIKAPRKVKVIRVRAGIVKSGHNLIRPSDVGMVRFPNGRKFLEQAQEIANEPA